MTLPEIEFELSAAQYKLMGFPGLQQGESLSLVLDGGILLPDSGAEHWYAVQAEPLEKRFVRIGPATYAFAGQIVEADIEYGREQLAYLSIDCGAAHLRVTCAPGGDGQMPYGTWETRHICGLAYVQGIVEDSYENPVGRNLNVIIWHFQRLVLAPGDAVFGEWHETSELPPHPLGVDRVFVTARIHKEGV